MRTPRTSTVDGENFGIKGPPIGYPIEYQEEQDISLDTPDTQSEPRSPFAEVSIPDPAALSTTKAPSPIRTEINPLHIRPLIKKPPRLTLLPIADHDARRIEIITLDRLRNRQRAKKEL